MPNSVAVALRCRCLRAKRRGLFAFDLVRECGRWEIGGSHGGWGLDGVGREDLPGACGRGRGLFEFAEMGGFGEEFDDVPGGWLFGGPSRSPKPVRMMTSSEGGFGECVEESSRTCGEIEIEQDDIGRSACITRGLFAGAGRCLPCGPRSDGAVEKVAHAGFVVDDRIWGSTS